MSIAIPVPLTRHNVSKRLVLDSTHKKIETLSAAAHILKDDPETAAKLMARAAALWAEAEAFQPRWK